MITIAQVQAEMVLGFTAPKTLENEEQARAYLRLIFASLDRMRPNGDELEHIWEAFKREWKFPHWPIPSELCGRLTKFRQAQGSMRKAVGEMGDASAAAIEHRPYHHGEFMAAMATARANAAEGHPRWAGLDKAILRMGEALMRNRDDHDRPRYPESRE